MAKAIFIIGLMLALCLPVAQMISPLAIVPPLDENRAKAAAPTLVGGWSGVDDYARQAVAWFNDHYGFRDFFIRLKTQIDYSVFHTSTRIHIGDDGWLYYRSVMDREKPATDRMLKTEAAAVADGIRRFADKLAARGIKLVVLVPEMKDVLYPEHLPGTVNRLPSPRQFDFFQDRLRSMKEIIFIDSTPILKEQAKTHIVFHRTDFHWNEVGAFAVSRALADRLGREEGKTEPVWRHELETKILEFSGGEALFMPLFYPPKEPGLFVKESWAAPVFTETPGPFRRIFENGDAQAQKMPAIGVIGDSFFDNMMYSGFGLYFPKIYRTHWGWFPTMSDAVEKMPVDMKYLIVEFIEVQTAAYEFFKTK